MMEGLFLKISGQLQQKLPFAAYRKPEDALVRGFFQKNPKLYEPTDLTESGFVFAPFEGKAVLIPDRHSEVCTVKGDGLTDSVTSADLKMTSGDSRRRFEKMVCDAVSAIKAIQFEKVVLSRKETFAIEDFNPANTFRKLLRMYPSAFVSWFYHPEIGMWMGATPETLVRIEDRNFKTMALAGTQKFNGTDKVFWGEKEIYEQRFVTDFIRQEVTDVAVNVIASEAYTHQAGSLLHLRTDISGRLKRDKVAADIIKALHPTPAVCGSPKQAAKAFILANEGYDRRYYSGFLGELNLHGGTDLYVNLRCMEIEDHSVSLYVGCGITKDSYPAAEFEETVNKEMTIRSILNI